MAITITTEERTSKGGKAYLLFSATGHPYGMPIWIAPDKATLEAFGNALLSAAKTAGQAVNTPSARELKRAEKSSATSVASVSTPADLQAMIAAAVAAALAGQAAPVPAVANGAAASTAEDFS